MSGDLFLLHVFSVFDGVCHIPQNLLATLNNEGTVVTCLYQSKNWLRLVVLGKNSDTIQ